MATAARIESIPLDKLVESPTNPRKNFGDLAELAASIKEKGVLQPVLVRLQSERGTTHFELVFGHRRFRAAKLAGLEELPAMVQELTDKEVLEAQIIENGQREDVHPLEEAEGFERLTKEHGYAAEDLAAKIGKDKSYVYKRLKLCNLTPPSRKAFYDGKITPAVAYLVARIDDAGVQADALSAVTREPFGNRELDAPMSLQRASEIIQQQFMLQLANAPFDTKDEDLHPLAGACTTCPKRTGNQKELFSDIKSKDVCTDPACFAVKRDAGWKKRAASAQAEGVRVLNEKETKKVFPYAGDTHVGYSSPYAELSATCYDDPKHRTYKQLIGKLAPIAIARDGRGGVHELVDKSQIPALLKKAGHDFKASRGANPSSTYDQQHRAAQKKAKLLREVGKRALAKISSHLQVSDPSKELWLAAATAAVTRSYGAEEALYELHGVTSESALKKAMKQMTTEQLRNVVLEAELAPHADVGTYARGFDEIFVAAAKAARVDVKSIQAEVVAEKETKKPAKKGMKAAVRFKAPAPKLDEVPPEPGDEDLDDAKERLAELQDELAEPAKPKAKKKRAAAGEVSP